MFRPAESKIDEIISKKLIVPDLATSKRLDERKKVKPRVLNLFKLYDILEIRPPAADRPYTLREELQAGMTERNQLVRESIRKWERRWVAGINRREKC